VTLKLRDNFGAFHAIGGLRGPEIEVSPDSFGVVPHLNRMGPDGRWLATWDDLRKTVQLRDTEKGAGVESRRIRVTGLRGAVTHMRWLSDLSGVVFLTDKNLFVARFDVQGTDDGAWAHPVFGKRKDGTRPEVLDVRMTPTGFVALTDAGYDEDAGHQLRDAWFVHVAWNRVAPPRRFTPKTGRVRALSVRSSGRVVLAMAGLKPSEDSDSDVTGALWTLRLDNHGHSRVIERRDCETDDCDVTNWSPGTRRLVYTTADGAVVIVGRGDKQDVVIDFGDFETPTHTLWLDKRERRLLLANREMVSMYDMAGNELWSWSPKNGDTIHSARFDLDNKTVLATAGRRALRVAGGKAKLLFKTRMQAKPWKEGDDYLMASEVFVDDIIPLGNGALAYGVVVAKVSEVEEEYDEEDYESEDE